MNQPNKKFYTPGEALQKIAAYCAYQERTHNEVRDKLFSYGLNGEETDDIIIRLSQEKILDEERYAKSFVRGRHRIKKWGRRRLMQELKQKGLSDYCIKSGLKEIDGDEYYANLVGLLEKKNALEKESHPVKRRQKLQLFLTAKGYEQDLIKIALDDLGKDPGEPAAGRRYA
ncbi:recombination regulator RecX [Hymenobacter sp. BT175]|uniref:regulatory protein RecX n=1 Tax=Hymenobacter translucens TaxID=2886507 RepID=UPI001D0F326D|nr:regulatory protein RecX [Hymenobacter translucens]MCC2546086.1 recombination regulator RecX [Hymenobacter translucens]